jgi:hypothetical protein
MSIGEFQNRPGLGTGAKRASDQDLSESGGLGCTEGKENGIRTKRGHKRGPVRSCCEPTAQYPEAPAPPG